MIDFVRWAVYICIVGLTGYYTHWSVGLAFLIVFFLLEAMLVLLHGTKRVINSIKLLQEKQVSTEFGFNTDEINVSEADLVDRIRHNEDEDAAAIFLADRCKNNLLNFASIPAPLRLILAKRLINAITREEEDSSWEALLKE